jgi:hypothetical protein
VEEAQRGASGPGVARGGAVTQCGGGCTKGGGGAAPGYDGGVSKVDVQRKG